MNTRTFSISVAVLFDVVVNTVISDYRTSSLGRPLPYVILGVKFMHFLGANFVTFWDFALFCT